MKPIGGYFELELGTGGNYYHDTPYAMKSGRSALHHILNAVNPVCVFIPYYTCDALLEPFDAANVPYRFYPLNEHLEPQTLIELKENEYFLYVNYFDLKRDIVGRLSEKYKDKLIVDCTQAFFMKGNNVSWFFNSCRKFFGVPDGSYLYPPAGMEVPLTAVKNEHYITDHLIKRFNGHPSEGYKSFQENEVLAGSDIRAMSKLSEHLLSQVSYQDVIEKRRANFAFLHERFKRFNLLVPEVSGDYTPMCYPLLLNKEIDKSVLFAQNIFIPAYWKDTLNRDTGFDLEKRLTNTLLPLPVDHRYTTADMEFMHDKICSLI